MAIRKTRPCKRGRNKKGKANESVHHRIRGLLFSMFGFTAEA